MTGNLVTDEPSKTLLACHLVSKQGKLMSIPPFIAWVWEQCLNTPLISCVYSSENFPNIYCHVLHIHTRDYIVEFGERNFFIFLWEVWKHWSLLCYFFSVCNLLSNGICEICHNIPDVCSVVVVRVVVSAAKKWSNLLLEIMTLLYWLPAHKRVWEADLKSTLFGQVVANSTVSCAVVDFRSLYSE